MSGDVTTPGAGGEHRDSRHVGKPSRRNPNGAPLCGAMKRDKSGDTCARPAGWGTPQPGIGPCKLHGGSTRNGIVAAEKVVAERAAVQLRAKLKRFDEFDGSEIDYRAEALRLIAFAKHRVEFFGLLLQQAHDAAERLRQAHEAGALLVDDQGALDAEAEGVTEDPNRQTARQDLERIFGIGGVTAFVGNKWDADRNGRVYAVDEGERALSKLEREAVADLRDAIKLAKDLKVADAQIDLARQVGAQIVEVLKRVLTEYGIAVDAAAMAVIAKHMDAVAAGPRVITGSAV